MVPLRSNSADRVYTDQEIYRLGVIEERSANSHSHFFAALNEAWQNLPEALAEQFPTVEHLRKYALIKAGFYDEKSLVCSSKAEAQRLAAFVKPMDGYAVVTVSEAVVRVFTAKSQSKRAMGAKDFQDSKQKVLDLVSAMIGSSSAQLAKNAGRAA